MSALVAGVGMVRFSKPGAQEAYPVMASEAIRVALRDAGLGLEDVAQAYAGYCYGATTCGQRALYEVGMTGIPVINVRNACATGSSALLLANQAVASGAVDVALAFGFEEMKPGALVNEDFRVSPVDRIVARFNELGYPVDEAMSAPGFFGAAGQEYLSRYDAKADIFAKVAVKTRTHAANNPMALFTKPITVEEVMESPVIWGDYLTRLMACPPTCGAAAAIVVSERFARERGLTRMVRIAGQAMGTDGPEAFDSAIDLVGRGITQRAAASAFAQAGVGPQDVDVVELHDCFTTNEVINYEALGLCGEGEASRFIADGDNSYGGKVVVNPSGGLMSKGHPLGATGLAQCTELVQQLRGEAGARQVEGARVALQHNIGMGSAGVVTLYVKD
ncbi:acetyl-CoA acetyltransferase [Sphingobium sp. OAS761]|uniref:thiolase C-terminal domain-containing protein n=1 Tax=Sphingobium sp. OAS761 TaxID=2817901 RepID=UPI0020A1A1DC|nr:lipid-transfer protein [Sphingobium sp. OAS761]MCP1470180.1 acetyl-CoA acetyltransferase [Sphingobium sp. OAS761]